MFPERRFKWLLRLLPGSFREEHEQELLRIWRAELNEARRQHRGGVWTDALKDTLRVAPREHVDTWMRNAKVATRSLRRSPAFALTAILTLALGTGATTAVFAVVNGVLLRPLPWTDPDRVGIVWPIEPGGERTWLSYPEFEDLQRDVSAFTGVAGFTDLRPNLVVNGTGRELQALAVSHGFLDLLGVAPALGRDFSADDDRQGAARCAILSHAFWRSQFGGDSNVLGRVITLNEQQYSVIGVLPPSFAILPASSVLPERVDLWLPLQPHLPTRDRSVRFLHVLARLHADVTFSQASEQLHTFSESATSHYPAIYRGGAWRFTVTPFKDDVLSETRTALYLISGLVLLVLLIACSNVANLLLARGEMRHGELALRSALGAGPARLAGELLTEALVLASAGSAVGCVLAGSVLHVLRAFDPAALPRLSEAHLDWNVGLFVVGLAFVSTVIFAFAPMLERVRLRDANSVMIGRSAGRTRRSARAGRILVVSQTALATIVLITTCFVVDSFAKLHRSDLGFDVDNLLTARVTLSPKYAGAPAAQYFTSAIDAATQVSGVLGAAAITQLPLSGAMLGSTFLVEQAPAVRRVDAELRGITPNYFEVVGTPMMQGRPFAESDDGDSVPVAIVDEAFARRLDPGANVVGRRIRWFRQPDTDIEIVGVVRAVRHRGAAEPAAETVYRPHRQYPRSSMFLAVRTRLKGAATAESIRAAVQAIDPSQPFADVSTMEERVDRSISGARTNFMLAGVLAGLALALGMIGLYGVLSFGVAQRRREFGVRMSLGSSAADVRMLVVAEGLRLTITGVAIGAVGAAIVTSVLKSNLYGMPGMALPEYVVGIALVVLTSVVALWLPAQRAGAVDPMIVLRSD